MCICFAVYAYSRVFYWRYFTIARQQLRTSLHWIGAQFSTLSLHVVSTSFPYPPSSPLTVTLSELNRSLVFISFSVQIAVRVDFETDFILAFSESTSILMLHNNDESLFFCFTFLCFPLELIICFYFLSFRRE
jgi:hypothetical protein